MMLWLWQWQVMVMVVTLVLVVSTVERNEDMGTVAAVACDWLRSVAVRLGCGMEEDGNGAR